MFIHWHEESVIFIKAFHRAFSLVLFGRPRVFVFIIRELDVIFPLLVVDILILIPVFDLHVVVVVDVRTF